MARGGIAGDGYLRDAPDASTRPAFDQAQWPGPGDPTAKPIGAVTIQVDDSIVALTDAVTAPVLEGPRSGRTCIANGRIRQPLFRSSTSTRDVCGSRSSQDRQPPGAA